MPAPPTFTVVLTDLQGVVHGDLPAKDLRVSLPLNRLPTAGITVPLWHLHAEKLLNGDCLMKVYRRDSVSNKLIFNGPVLSVEENGDPLAQSIAVSAVGPFHRLTKRLVGKSKAGIEFGTQASPMDLATIAKTAITTTNGDHYTGIEVTASTDDPSIANGSTGQMWMKNVAELVSEISSSLNAFDFVVTPTEPTNVGKAWPQIGLFETAPLIGTQKPNAIFEYGTPRANVTSYKRMRSGDQLLNRAIVGVQGWPDGTTRDLVQRSDATSIAARGLFEEQVNDGGILDDTLRAQIGDEHLLYRKQPKVTTTFTVALNATPSALVHYGVGDWVRARAKVKDSTRFDYMARVWGIAFNVDNNGNENVELELVQE